MSYRLRLAATRAGVLSAAVATVALLLGAPAAFAAATATTSATKATVGSATRWAPSPGAAWQWVLSAPLTASDLRLDVPAFEIDGFDNTAATVAALHAGGRRAICYIDAGTSESWRSDFGAFPKSVLGRSNGWSGERWLDVRQLSTLAPIMGARLDMCRTKGFDAVEADNVDGFENPTGFAIKSSDQLRYNRWLADQAHARGMSIALKNDLGQVDDLVGTFDFAVNEECAKYAECDRLIPFIRAGKAVLHVEYGTGASFCATTKKLGFSSMVKRESLDAYRKAC